MRVLFDTNAVVYWYDDVEAFRSSLYVFFGGIAKSDASFFISAVTIHEMSGYQIRKGTWSSAEKFLAEKFQVVVLDDPTARRAGELWARHHVGSAKTDWHRDTAIVATAIAIGADVLVTADDFTRYTSSLAPCRVHRLGS